MTSKSAAISKYGCEELIDREKCGTVSAGCEPGLDDCVHVRHTMSWMYKELQVSVFDLLSRGVTLFFWASQQDFLHRLQDCNPFNILRNVLQFTMTLRQLRHQLFTSLYLPEVGD